MSGVTLDGSDGKITIQGSDGTEADVVTGGDGVNRLQIEVTGGSGGTDELVKVSPNDTTPATLTEKILPGTNVTIVENNDGGNETLTISASGGGGGVTDHGALTGLGDDDHPQYLNEARHDALPFDNPHNVDATQVGLGNVDNTSDVDKPVSTAQQTALDLKYDSSNPAGYIDASGVPANETVTTLVESPANTFTYTSENGTTTQFTTGAGGGPPIFGSEAEDWIDTSNTNITTATPFAVRTFTTQTKPAGRYRIFIIPQFEPGSASNNYEFSLRVNGGQIGLELEEEGKDVGGDQRNLRPLLGYYDHTGGTFDIELWASREGNTLVLHGWQGEVWRVS